MCWETDLRTHTEQETNNYSKLCYIVWKLQIAVAESPGLALFSLASQLVVTKASSNCSYLNFRCISEDMSAQATEF